MSFTDVNNISNCISKCSSSLHIQAVDLTPQLPSAAAAAACATLSSANRARANQSTQLLLLLLHPVLPRTQAQ
jgi:hypothetical protein